MSHALFQNPQHQYVRKASSLLGFPRLYIDACVSKFLAAKKNKSFGKEDSNLRPLDPEANGIPFYVVDILNNTRFRFSACATFVPFSGLFLSASFGAK